MPVDDEHASEGIPFTPDTFVGRANEIAEISSLLATARLFTLTGPGGVGKTRLAVQLAAGSGGFEDGVRWVDLGSVTDSVLLPHLVAERCGVTVPGGTAVVDVLAGALRSQHLLLVLDNCEHMLSACSRLIDTLLAACPALHVLVTSRELLAIPGEVNWLVAPLSVPAETGATSEDLLGYDAVRLFVARATATLPGFRVTPDNAASISRICRRVDGLPLALELAASSLRVLSPLELAERLDHAMGVLTRGSRTAPERQRTLRATLDWSYRLLDDTERRVFARLSVFAGGFTLPAAEHICAGPEPPPSSVLDAIARLVDASLVIVFDRGEETRYRLLEPLRQYASERLAETGEMEDVCRRRGTWYADLATQATDELTGPEQGRWLDRLETEHDNLRAVIGWSLDRGDAAGAGWIAAGIWPFWLQRGHVHEGRHWLGQILAALNDPKPLRAHLSWIAGILQRPHARAGERRFTESLEIYRRIGDREGEARALGSLGFLFQACGEHSRAVSCLEASLAVSRDAPGPSTRGRVLTGLALSVLALDDPARAASLCREARELFREAGDVGGDAAATANLGLVCRARGDDRQAEALLNESLAVRRRIGDHGGVAHSLTLLGSLAVSQGSWARATTLFHESLDVCRQIGDEHTLAVVCEGVAAVAAAQGMSANAVQLAGAASSIRAATGEAQLPWEREAHDRSVHGLRAALDHESFDRAWHEGEAMETRVAFDVIARLEAVRVVASTGAGPEPLAAQPAPAATARAVLTPREVEVLRLLTFGLTYAQIGDSLVISPRTVDAHVRSIFGKLDVHSRSAATRVALQERLI